MTLPPVTSLECIRALLKLGYTIRRQIQGAVSLERPGRIVVVPLGKVLSEEALLLVLLAARVTRDEFVAALTPSTSGEHAVTVPDAKADDSGKRTA